MKEKVLNQELRITYDETFHELTEEEIAKMNFLSDKPQLCLSDPERHILITAGHRQINGFSAMMLNVKDIAKKSQEQVRGAMKNLGYTEEQIREVNIGGRKAEGFRFGYTADGIEMSGETIVLKSGRTLYYINCYYRTALKADSEPAIRQILESASWLA